MSKVTVAGQVWDTTDLISLSLVAGTSAVRLSGVGKQGNTFSTSSKTSDVEVFYDEGEIVVTLQDGVEVSREISVQDLLDFVLNKQAQAPEVVEPVKEEKPKRGVVYLSDQVKQDSNKGYIKFSVKFYENGALVQNGDLEAVQNIVKLLNYATVKSVRPRDQIYTLNILPNYNDFSVQVEIIATNGTYRNSADSAVLGDFFATVDNLLAEGNEGTSEETTIKAMPNVLFEIQ